MLPRILRVTRAKALKKTGNPSQNARPSSYRGGSRTGNSAGEHSYAPKISSQQQSLQGRAEKLLGKAGAANLRKQDNYRHRENPQKPRLERIVKSPEEIVFEGYRASTNSGRPKGLKLGQRNNKRKASSVPSQRTKRAAEWKKKGGK